MPAAFIESANSAASSRDYAGALRAIENGLRLDAGRSSWLRHGSAASCLAVVSGVDGGGVVVVWLVQATVI